MRFSTGTCPHLSVKVEFSLEGLNIAQLQRSATSEQIKAYILEHNGLKVSTLYIAQVKQNTGLPSGSATRLRCDHANHLWKQKKKTTSSAKHTNDFRWRAQQDSNLWPFDSQPFFDFYIQEQMCLYGMRLKLKRVIV